MVGMGMLNAIAGVLGLVLRRGQRIYETRWFQRFTLLNGPSGLVALLAVWNNHRSGAATWVVYGILRTKDASSRFGRTRWQLFADLRDRVCLGFWHRDVLHAQLMAAGSLTVRRHRHAQGADVVKAVHFHSRSPHAHRHVAPADPIDE